MRKFILIGGISRSGTNLVRRVIGSHSKIAIPPGEFNFFSKYNNGKTVKEILANAEEEQNAFINQKQPFLKKLPGIWSDVLSILKGVTPYVLIGIAIGGLMHGYIPENFFEKYMSKDNLFAVPVATILAVPMYSNASGILPVVQVLVAKGIPIGTAIAFMMGVVGLSTPEALLLKKVMTIKLIGIFFGTVTVCIIISGYLFNIFL